MKKYKTGITFGAFDPIHFGHIELFIRAKNLCEKLIVCVSTNAYIEGKKGRKERFSYRKRARSVAAVRCVDIVGNQSPYFSKKQAVKKYKADVIFVGSDWNPKTFTGEGLGIPVVYLPRTKGISSSELVKNI